MTKTPLPLWFVPEEDEPAHGILIRLAERNGIEGYERVPALTGLRVARLRVGNGAERLGSIIRCEPAVFMKSTALPDKGGNVILRGERLSVIRDLTRLSRRLCSGCVAASAHHRFWFDLKFVTTCPEHSMNLVDVCSCGRKLSWKDVRIAKCRHCEDGNVALLPKCPVNADVIAMDRWVLGKLGVGSSRPLPILDAMNLTDALDTMGRIGSLDLGGYRDKWVQPQDFDIPTAEVRARGYRVLESNSLGDVLEKVYRGFVRTKSSKPAALHSAYGWFGHWFTFRKAEKFSKGLAEIILAHASANFQVQRGSFPTLDWQATSSSTLTDASKEVGVAPATLRTLLDAEGRIRKDKRKGSPVAVKRDHLARLAEDYADSITFAALAPLLGVGGTIVKKLRDVKEIPVWIPGGKHGSKHRYVIRRRDVEEWVDNLVGNVSTLASVPETGLLLADAPLRKHFPVVELVRAIRNGTVAIIGRLDGQPQFGGAILRMSDVDAAVPADVKKKLGSQRRGPRGPYGKQKHKRNPSISEKPLRRQRS